MPAVAFSNNDIAVVAWTFDRHLGRLSRLCNSSNRHRRQSQGNGFAALARFANQDKDLKLTTEQARSRNSGWKDLFCEARGTYQYRIVPMGGSPGGTLTPLPLVDPPAQQPVTLTPKRPPFKRLFQPAVSRRHEATRPCVERTKPSINALAPHILDPTDPIRIRLMGQLSEGVNLGSTVRMRAAAPFMRRSTKLNDPAGLESVCRPIRKSRIVILGNEQSVDRKNE